MNDSDKNLTTHTILEAISDPVILVDEQDRISYANSCMGNVTGYTQTELRGKPVTILLPGSEPDRRDVKKVLQKISKGDLRSTEIVTTIQRKSGDQRTHRWNVSVLEHYESSGKNLVIIGRDITERKEADRQLLLQSTALKAAANGIVITDTEGTVQWINPAFTELTGYTKADITGKTTSILKSGKHDDAFYENLWETITRGKVWEGEMINRRKDGSLYTEEQTITPVIDGSGNIINYIAIKHDVSARKQAEAEREKLITQLEDSLAKIKTLRGLIPICSNCKKIRDDEGYWHQVEEYVRDHSDAEFSHGICTDCAQSIYPDIFPEE
ncbi:MAG: PAS domain S-box protein [Candidatus Marinimicrobia bacterium]|nr:PAS domain S-box protein [Candidatus Neomarinimicrobiota bacterium]MCF7828372.1 PAS domain S-box protein [Candidatus Neomarinimicrobiota bacterium]MCF7881034.1 PAS domain S-box protein [Candidatus Neomarinimicrobiota bacterium]